MYATLTSRQSNSYTLSQADFASQKAIIKDVSPFLLMLVLVIICSQICWLQLNINLQMKL